MTQLYAQPYDLSATGFYFETSEEYSIKSAALCNDYGDPVEEFEIQFIDGDETDCVLANAIGLNQANFTQFLSAVDDWDDGEKRAVIIAVGECGYTFELDLDPAQFEVDIYENATMGTVALIRQDTGWSPIWACYATNANRFWMKANSPRTPGCLV